jgi:hypothetical protein
MPSIAFDRFYRYDDLTAIVKALAADASGPRLPRIDRKEP